MTPPQPPNGAAGVEIRGAAVSSCLVRPALASSTRPPSSMEPSIPQRTRSESCPLLLHSPPLSSSPLPSMEQPHPQSRVMLPASFGYHPAPSSAMNWNAIHLVPSSSSSFDSVPFSTATRPVAAFSNGAQVAAARNIGSSKVPGEEHFFPCFTAADSSGCFSGGPDPSKVHVSVSQQWTFRGKQTVVQRHSNCMTVFSCCKCSIWTILRLGA